jgi:hypothetical protein
MTELGKAGFLYRGNYSASDTYNRMDVVTYLPNVYICLKNVVRNITPNDDGINWKLFIKGASIQTTAEMLAALDNAQATADSAIAKIGQMNDLNLEEKSSIVAALNRLYDDVCARNAGARNGIYRGKKLGTSVTAAQWASIQNGTFLDMYIGDYWVIDGVTWRIAAFDYWLGFGDTACNVHHIVIVPDQNLLNADGSTTHYMNTRDVTTGGYIDSGFRSGTNADNTSNTARAQCRSKIQAVFGASHILTHREYFTNAVTDEHASGGSWYDSDVDLMNEIMVYGCPIFTPANNGTTIPSLYTIDNSQLPLFKLNHAHICNSANWWLRDPVSAAFFAYVANNGLANSYTASAPWVGVRPAFGIC